MKYNEIKQVIQNLAQSQGFYGSLLNAMNDAEENDIDQFNQMADYLELQNFKDPVDIVLFFET